MKDILYFNTLEDIKLTDMMRVLKKKEEHDYSKDYLTFEALESGTFNLTVPARVDSTYMTSISYSLDDGETWTTTTIDNTSQTITTPTINIGSKVLWKGIGKQIASASSGRYSQFSSTGNFNVSGNIMSLLCGDDFQNNTSFNRDSNHNFYSVFKDATKLTDAVKLILPVTTLTNNCYENMFNGCTLLTTAPELPATTLADYCYSYMFSGCTSLTTAPELLATKLATSCYSYMFSGCTSLTAGPVLPATKLADNCYQDMFNGCTMLITPPELPATTLTKGCYVRMFSGCTSLTDAPELLATNPQGGSKANDISYYEMFRDCTSLVNAPSILPATALTTSCYTNMFYGCTALIIPPELPATTLASYCYNGMFQSCTSLTAAPELPAATLVEACYINMFRDCLNLNHIKAMFTTTPSNSYTQNWVNGVAATGTFVKNSTATWTTTGTNGVPSGWTVETADS